ncbi:uncharacterized protein V1510DRAFT_413153 [Dipodascopsis tothii]|uniref:uncharacterized protein n=1 Tax=Dipodascopsis tothii TaxID=44089 RepID=UPI0034CD9B98
MFRGFAVSQSSGVLTMTTDRRMPKHAQLLSPSSGGAYEACFYFHDQQKQFRFSGTVKVLALADAAAAARTVVLADPVKADEPASAELEELFFKAWNELTTAMKLSFAKPPPGAKLSDESVTVLDHVEQLTAAAAAGKDLDPVQLKAGLANFAVVLLGVEEVDYVDVTGVGRRIRFLKPSEYEWTLEEVNP